MDKSWLHARAPQELVSAVHDNLRNLGMDALNVVNLRWGGMASPEPGSIEEAVTALAELKQQGLIQQIGLSNVNAEQLKEAQKITPIVCIQNLYNVAKRDDDAFIDDLAAQGIAYVPFFPLGGFTPPQSTVLDSSAQALGVTPMQVRWLWLLQRAVEYFIDSGHVFECASAREFGGCFVADSGKRDYHAECDC